MMTFKAIYDTCRDACVAAFAALGRAMDETDHPLGTGTVSNPVIKALMELVAEHSREAQYVGCGALGHVVESTGGLEHGLIKTLIRVSSGVSERCAVVAPDERKSEAWPHRDARSGHQGICFPKASVAAVTAGLD